MEETVDSHVADLRINDAVARLEERPKKGAQGGDTAGQDDSVIGIVQGDDLFFQPVLVRIAVAGVHQKIRR